MEGLSCIWRQLQLALDIYNKCFDNILHLVLFYLFNVDWRLYSRKNRKQLTIMEEKLKVNVFKNMPQ
jgi:hypothetical protein